MMGLETKGGFSLAMLTLIAGPIQQLNWLESGVYGSISVLTVGTAGGRKSVTCAWADHYVHLQVMCWCPALQLLIQLVRTLLRQNLSTALVPVTY